MDPSFGMDCADKPILVVRVTALAWYYIHMSTVNMHIAKLALSQFLMRWQIRIVRAVDAVCLVLPPFGQKIAALILFLLHFNIHAAVQLLLMTCKISRLV